MAERRRVVGEAIERWYTANYPRGVRLTFQQRAALADSINYRLDLIDSAEAVRTLDDMPNEDELPDALLAMARELGQCPSPGCVCVSGHTGDHYIGERTP